MTTVHRHDAKPGLLYYQPGEVTVVLEWDPEAALPRARRPRTPLIPDDVLNTGLGEIVQKAAGYPLNMKYPAARRTDKEPREALYFSVQDEEGNTRWRIYQTVNLASWSEEPLPHPSPDNRDVVQSLTDVRDVCAKLNDLDADSRRLTGTPLRLLGASPNWLAFPLQYY